MQKSLESMQAILRTGQINDAFSLLRKYYDAIVINIYTNLFIEENYTIENEFVITKITNWFKGKETLPRYADMLSYILSSARLKKLNSLIAKNTVYKKIRNRCNEHTHYNRYYHFVVNDGRIYLKNRLAYLSRFAADLENLFILHFVYLFYVSSAYMAASDYFDSLDCGLKPEEGSQYLVAPFVQEIFVSLVMLKRPDLALELKNNSGMVFE